MSAESMLPETTGALSVVEAEAPAAARRTPLALIVDSDGNLRQFIGLVLAGMGIDSTTYTDGEAFREAPPPRSADLAILDVAVDAQDAILSLHALAEAGFRGAVQLISGRGSAVLDTVATAGEEIGLAMLPALKKPFETAAIQKVVSDLNLDRAPPSAEFNVSLAEALANGWVEFWYQPKIDLRKKRLAGAEAFARIHHPQHGMLTPACFINDASESDLLALAELSLVAALKSGLNLSRLGVDLRIAINVPVPALIKLPVGDIVRAHRPQVKNWAGLIIDVTEAQIITEITLANELNAKLKDHNVRLAIDDFGKSYVALMQLTEMPFAEMKLDPLFVNGCGTNPIHGPICKTVVGLAHSFGSIAVGMGLEKASDARALAGMGCDLGQGYLLGQPMPEERFLALLRQRVIVKSAPGNAAAQTPPDTSEQDAAPA